MALQVTINTSSLLDPYPVGRGDVESITQQAVEAVSWEVYNRIRDKANSELKSMRRLYIDNLNQPEIGRLKGTIVLTGKLPNMVESGAPEFDMKGGFSNSSKKHTKKNGGWYLTVPFRLATPGSIGENPAFSGVMPKQVHNIAKKIESSSASFGSIGGKKQFEAELKGTKFGEVKTKTSGFGEYQHKAPIFSGMTKSTAKYEKGSGAKYSTFRRVSDKSDPSSWIHPGFIAKRLFNKAINEMNIEGIVGKTVHNALKTLGL